MLLTALLFAASLASAEEIAFWVAPCSEPARTNCRPEDTDLAVWALAAWQQASAGRVSFRRVAAPDHARFRFQWESKDSGLFGEAEPIVVDGKRGALLHILIDARTQDPLLRDTIVYLTCLHESGHALGLPHTAAFADIMYSFQYGGDIAEYFGRYRRLLNRREEIREHSGISPADRARLLAVVR